MFQVCIVEGEEHADDDGGMLQQRWGALHQSRTHIQGTGITCFSSIQTARLYSTSIVQSEANLTNLCVSLFFPCLPFYSKLFSSTSCIDYMYCVRLD